jgi:(4S)-4-hydroxy-5-phosphonooxypentane-2,3-dione isomerase
MFIVFVHVQVKPEYVDQFRQASIKNAVNSIKEPGIARFDVVQASEDPTKFVLVEVYRTAQDAVKHKKTAHYAVWSDEVMTMMAEPRHSVKYDNVFPADMDW